MEQDLATCLECCPSHGLGPDRIRVSVQEQSSREGMGCMVVLLDNAEINLTLGFEYVKQDLAICLECCHLG